MSKEERAKEIVLVVELRSFTKAGFIGSARFADSEVSIEFDDKDEGVTLSTQMCQKLGVRKNSKLSILAEVDGRPELYETFLATTNKSLKISNAKVYYFVGRATLAILRISKAP
jgi:ABC-type lipoprotein release transport system permease subunit